MKRKLPNSARRANNIRNTTNQKKAKSGVGNMTRFSRVVFEQRAKTNQKRTQAQANKLTLAPTLRAIKPVKPAVRGKPFGERVFCPAGCETVSVISEPIDGGMKLFIKYPSAENAARAKRGISILRSDIKGKRVLLQALPNKQKQAWRKTAIQLANHSSPSTIVLKFSSMREGGEARLPPEFASRIFSSYPDFMRQLTQESIIEYWKHFIMTKFQSERNTPLSLKDIQKKLTNRDLISKGNSNKHRAYKQPYRILQVYAADIARMANEIRLKNTNEVNIATKRNNRLRAAKPIPPKIVMLTYQGQIAFYIEDKGGSRAYFPVTSDVDDALKYYRNLKILNQFFKKVDEFTTHYGPNTQKTLPGVAHHWNNDQRMFRKKNKPKKSNHWEYSKKSIMRIRDKPIVKKNGQAVRAPFERNTQKNAFFLLYDKSKGNHLRKAIRDPTPAIQKPQVNVKSWILQIENSRGQLTKRMAALDPIPRFGQLHNITTFPQGLQDIMANQNTALARATVQLYLQQGQMEASKAKEEIKSFLKPIETNVVAAKRKEIQDPKYQSAMRNHNARSTNFKVRKVFVRHKGDNVSPVAQEYGHLVTGMIAKVRNEGDVERILIGTGIDGFTIKPFYDDDTEFKITFKGTSVYGNGATKVQKLSTSGEGREEVYTKFLKHLGHSQIAPIMIESTNHKQVTDLQSMLTGTNAFKGRALCWLKSFVFDPKKQVIFGDRNTKIADRRKNMKEFAARLKLGRCQ